MKTMKKILCVLLVVLMCLTSAPVGGFVGLELPEWNFKASAANELAPTGQCGDNVYWEFDSATGELVISGSGAMYNYDDEYNISPFVLSKIKKLIIKDGVTHIGSYTFESCLYLESVTLCQSITSIGTNAFSVCESLTSIIIPDSVVSIGSGAFSLCYSLKNIIIPDSVTSIESGVFSRCENLRTIMIGRGVTAVNSFAFNDCINLTEINVDANNLYYSSVDGVLFNKNITELIVYPKGKKETLYTIPKSVTSISSSAFEDCKSLQNIIAQDNVVSIGRAAFSDCTNLESFIIPKGITSIEMDLFSGCSNLKNITIPDSVTSVGSGSFSGCISLESVTIPDSVTGIYYGAFLGCSSLTSITIYRNVKSITVEAFYCCDNLADVYFYGTEQDWNEISIYEYNEPLLNATIHFLGEEPEKPNENIYNLGEETYSFKNYIDFDSFGGHCFGMSVTSSSYYLGILNPTTVGASSSQEIYNLSNNSTVRKPICNYQRIQGSIRNSAFVAGYKDIETDWEEIISYVKSHEYDNSGKFVIGYGKNGGGHAVNFLRYEVVNGQERIYVYDNNFPDEETYFYKDSSGNVLQAPKETFGGAITDFMALMSVPLYMSTAKSVPDYPRFAVYAGDSIEILGADKYLMYDEIGVEQYVYELPEGTTTIEIKPLTDNVTFIYMDKEYSFSEISDKTYGVLTLSETGEEASFKIENNPDNCSCNCHAGGIKGFFFKFILFFQKIFRTNKVCKCGINHY